MWTDRRRRGARSAGRGRVDLVEEADRNGGCVKFLGGSDAECGGVASERISDGALVHECASWAAYRVSLPVAVGCERQRRGRTSLDASHAVRDLAPQQDPPFDLQQAVQHYVGSLQVEEVSLWVAHAESSRGRTRRLRSSSRPRVPRSTSRSCVVLAP